MLPVITVSNMRESDAYTIAHDVPSLKLMYRAAMGVYHARETWGGHTAIIAGSGNNGGDGYALAGILADHGFECCVYRLSDRFSTDGKYYYEKAVEKGVPMKVFGEGTNLNDYDVIVDCILGTGFSGEVRGLAKSAVEEINKSDAYVISVDINSGLNGDTGEAVTAVRSDLTVSIGYPKPGMFYGDADKLIGKLCNTDIGIKALREEYWLASEEELSFPESGRSLMDGEILTISMGELANSLLPGSILPEAARRLAFRNEKLLLVTGRNRIVTDGYRAYIIPGEGLLQN